MKFSPPPDKPNAAVSFYPSDQVMDRVGVRSLTRFVLAIPTTIMSGI